MKPHSGIGARVATILLAVISLGAQAAATGASTTASTMEICLKLHGKLMSKPALMNSNDCWRAHAYLMQR